MPEIMSIWSRGKRKSGKLCDGIVTTGHCRGDGADCTPTITPASRCRLHTSEAPMHTDERDHLQRDIDKSSAIWLKTTRKNGNRVSRTGGDRHRTLIVIFTSLERDEKGNDITVRRAYPSKPQKDKRSQSRDSSQGNKKKHNYSGNEQNFQGGQHRRAQARSRSPAKHLH